MISFKWFVFAMSLQKLHIKHTKKPHMYEIVDEDNIHMF